jgi:Protein of unknown function (DUF2924)
MQLNIAKEVAALRRLSTRDLRARYAETFGETTNANNRIWLVKRIAWRLQVQAEGDLSERARRRAAELANDADLRLSPPVEKLVAAPPEFATLAVQRRQTDERVPPPGTVITRTYKGETLQVQVLEHGFSFEGAVYKSLSAVARTITGQHCNGLHFFRLGQEASR